MRYQGRDFRGTQPRFTLEARRANWAVVELLQRVGNRHQATPGQVALAWFLARKPWIVPIPGTTNRNHTEQNMDALAVELSAADIKEIDEGSASVPGRKVRQERGAGRPALVDAARRGRHPQVGAQGAHGRELQRLRLRAERRGHGNDGKPRQQKECVLRPPRPSHGEMDRRTEDPRLNALLRQADPQDHQAASPATVPPESFNVPSTGRPSDFQRAPVSLDSVARECHHHDRAV